MNEKEQERPSIKIKHDLPKTGRTAYFIGRIWMWFFGWELEGERREGSKFVLIAAPHTSNWDVFFMLGAAFCYRIKLSWFVKHTLFKKPFRKFLSSVGAIPIQRNTRHGMVEQVVNEINNREKVVVTVSAPGTRKKDEYWRSGFYWIANNAKIPIVLGYLDYSKKIAGIGPSIMPSGDIKRDMDKIRDFYKGIMGKYPEKMSRIRLREEDV